MLFFSYPLETIVLRFMSTTKIEHFKNEKKNNGRLFRIAVASIVLRNYMDSLLMGTVE